MRLRGFALTGAVVASLALWAALFGLGVAVLW